MRVLLLTCLLCVSLSTFAAPGFVKGKVKYMRVHTPSTHPAWKPPIFWFSLEGVTSAGNCPLWEGNLLFYMDTKEAYSLIVGAYMANKEIAVAYDDTKLANYQCVAMYITIGDPPPLY